MTIAQLEDELCTVDTVIARERAAEQKTSRTAWSRVPGLLAERDKIVHAIQMAKEPKDRALELAKAVAALHAHDPIMIARLLRDQAPELAGGCSMTTTITFTQQSLAEALNNVRCLSDFGPELIAEQVFADAPAAPAPAALPFIPAHMFRDLARFNETCEDGQEYDVPKERMRAMASVGLVRWCGGSRFEITDCGLAALGAHPAPPAAEQSGTVRVQRELLMRCSSDIGYHQGESALWKELRAILDGGEA